MSTMRAPTQTQYLLLKVEYRFPVPGGFGELAARRIWPDADKVEALAEAELLAEMVAKIQELK